MGWGLCLPQACSSLHTYLHGSTTPGLTSASSLPHSASLQATRGDLCPLDLCHFPECSLCPDVLSLLTLICSLLPFPSLLSRSRHQVDNSTRETLFPVFRTLCRYHLCSQMFLTLRTDPDDSDLLPWDLNLLMSFWIHIFQPTHISQGLGVGGGETLLLTRVKTHNSLVVWEIK